MPLAVAPHDLGRIVGTHAIDDQHLDPVARVVVRHDGVETLHDERALVAHRNEDADERPLAHVVPVRTLRVRSMTTCSGRAAATAPAASSPALPMTNTSECSSSVSMLGHMSDAMCGISSSM